MANTLKIKRGTAATIPQGQLAEPLFTTDTYDLYIGKGSGGNQRIQNYIASGTSSQFLKGDGTLDSTSYEPLITAGTTLQYYRGDKTFQTLDTSVVPENGPIYFTEPRVRATVLTGLNLSGGGTIAATDSILTAFGKVQNQISALVGGATYQGTWNASTNTPTLASGTGTKGYYYVVSVAGSTNLDGITDWKIGDWAIFNGTTWDKVDNTDAVSSVNGFTGAVNLALDNISDVSAASPTNAQLLRFNGTSSLWENWTPTFEPALTKGNLTEATSSVLTITGGTGAVIGSGTTIAVAQSSGSTSGYLSSTDWTTFNNKQAALTNPVTGTGTNNYIPKFTATGSTIGDSSLYYSQGANSNSYTFGSVGAGAIYNLSQFNIYSNSTSEMFFQWGSNKYLYIGDASGNISISAMNTGTHDYNNIIYYNGSSASDRYIAFETEATTRLQIQQNGDIRLNKYTSNGFVKTSSANGTITIDTTSYLPLTGGTLTGALSGTSATFTNTTNAVTISNAADLWYRIERGASFTNIGVDATGSFYDTNTNHRFRVASGGTTAFTIASTGAATFSSSVTTSGASVSSTYGSLTVGGTGLTIADDGNAKLQIGRYSSGAANSYIKLGANSNSLRVTNKTDTADIFTIENGGNVGIGTTSPGTLLHLQNSSGPTLRLVRTSNRFDISADNDFMELNARDASTYMIFKTADTERMRITSGGDIQTNGGKIVMNINASTQTIWAGGYGGGIQLLRSDATSTRWGKFGVLDASGNWVGGIHVNNGGEVLINTETDSGAYYLQVNGSVYATAYYESSDIRLKDVLTNSYSENFSAIEFMWKDKRDDKKHWGYAAQDVMKYIPDAIEVNKDGMMTVNYNEAHTWKIAQLEAKILELEAKLK